MSKTSGEKSEVFDQAGEKDWSNGARWPSAGSRRNTADVDLSPVRYIYTSDIVIGAGIVYCARDRS